MKTTITLDEAELATAVREYLHRKGYVTVTRVTFNRDGYPDSPDPREQRLIYSASAMVES
jgi:hypothetical protein